MELILGGIACVALLPILWFVTTLNGLIAKRNQVENVWGSTEALLKKRYDLIPNLVETVKGYAAHEQTVFERVAELRAQSIAERRHGSELELNQQLSAAIGGVFAVAEAYPDLKASRSFLHLQATLTEVEEQISAARRAFNASVMAYNNAVQMFPSSLVAGFTGHKVMDYFSAQPEERENVRIG